MRFVHGEGVREKSNLNTPEMWTCKVCGEQSVRVLPSSLCPECIAARKLKRDDRRRGI